MEHKIKKQLKKLSDKQFAEDVKKYIRSPYEFYGVRAPELRTLAKKLHEEYILKDFYKTFDKLWGSGYHEEMSLAIYALQLYENEFDLKTWKFIKPKLNDMKSWDQIDAISTRVVGKILLKYPAFEKEILKLSENKDFWMRRIAIVSTLPLVKKGNIKLSMKLAEKYIEDKQPYIQKATGWVLREAGKEKPEQVGKFILKNINMPSITFSYATEKMTKLRIIRKQKLGQRVGFFENLFS